MRFSLDMHPKLSILKNLQVIVTLRENVTFVNLMLEVMKICFFVIH